MSTPPSFLDDSTALPYHLPSHPRPTHSDTSDSDTSNTSVYSGSFIDDGLDLFSRSSPWFGHMNALFPADVRGQRDGEVCSKDGKACSKDNQVWSPDMARAVGGDMRRSLNTLKGAVVRVRRACDESGESGESGGEEEGKEAEGKKKEKERKKKRRKRKKRDVITVPAPARWGDFIIKGDDGRVIVVSEKGEWDSGPYKTGEGEEEKGKRWVRATSPIISDRTSSSIGSAREKAEGRRSGNHGGKRSRARRGRGKSQGDSHEKSREEMSSPECDPDPNDPVTLALPTPFFMTGALTGWPSRTASPTLTTPTLPHAITWAASPPPMPHPKGREPTLSPPSKQSYTRATGITHGFRTISTTPQHHPSYPPSLNSNHSPFRYASVMSFETTVSNASSPHPAQDVVEVIYDSTPQVEASYAQVERGESTDPAQDEIQGGKMQGGSIVGGFPDWSDEDEKHQRADSGEEWDGFERPRTASEVSVYGGSVRSRGSRCRWSASQHSHRSEHTPEPRRRRYSGTGWDGEETTSRPGSAVHWSGGEGWSAQSWEESK